MNNELAECFSGQCLAAHADDPEWAEKVIAHVGRHLALPRKYMVQVLKDYGLICRTSTWRDCKFVDPLRREIRRKRRKERTATQ